VFCNCTTFGAGGRRAGDACHARHVEGWPLKIVLSAAMAIGMLTAGSAQADLCMPLQPPYRAILSPMDTSITTLPTANCEQATRLELDRLQRMSCWLAGSRRQAIDTPADLQRRPVLLDVAGARAVDPVGPGIQQLPSAPGSMRALLSGLLTLGAWRALQSARQLQVNLLPSRYCLDASEAVGTVAVGNLGRNTAPGYLVQANPPAGTGRYACGWVEEASRSHWQTRHTHPIAPRAPPPITSD
jgi:hypothetical protein